MSEFIDTRRACFVYEAAREQAKAALAPIIPEHYWLRDDDFQNQFVDVVKMMCGPDRKANPAELHQDWVDAYEKMGWVYGPERNTEFKTHPDMVPYEELEQREKDKDEVFVALCEIARLFIRE